MLLLSKADLLTPVQRYWYVYMIIMHSCCCRETWANYFDKEGISYAFWSAHLEAAKFDTPQSLANVKESCCNDDDDDDDEQEKQQESEDGEDLNLLSQAMARGFVLEDECVTMTTDHELTSEVPHQTNDSPLLTETDHDNIICSNSSSNPTTDTVTPPPSQTAVVDDVTDLPSQHGVAELTRVTNVSDQTMLLHASNTVGNSFNDSDIIHNEVETNVESNTSPSDTKIVDNNPRAKLLTGSELLDLFRSLCSKKVEKKDEEPVVIGMVGYPNVGKSSTINTLIQGKKVPVSATPGRTKHFQVSYVCVL